MAPDATQNGHRAPRPDQWCPTPWRPHASRAPLDTTTSTAARTRERGRSRVGSQSKDKKSVPSAFPTEETLTVFHGESRSVETAAQRPVLAESCSSQALSQIHFVTSSHAKRRSTASSIAHQLTGGLHFCRRPGAEPPARCVLPVPVVRVNRGQQRSLTSLTRPYPPAGIPAREPLDHPALPSWTFGRKTRVPRANSRCRTG